MKPVDQTRFGAPRGNCTEACLASLFEVKLEDVPDLAEEESWVLAIDRWTRSRFGLHMLVLEWHGSYLPEVEHMMSGMGPRDVRHAVVGQGGEIVHDPHPSRAGLITVDRLYLFVPPSLAPRSHPGWAD